MDSSSYTSSDDSSNQPSTSSNKHVCPYEGCNASFSKNSKLTYHIRRHTGERPFVCDEPNCGKTYLFSFHLRRHKDISHYGKKPSEEFPCPHEGCWRTLANKYSLKKHIKMKHRPEGQYPFNCSECKQGFHRKRQLMQHLYVHTGVLPYKCGKCETRFLTQRDRNRHWRTHTSYSCTCEETFERWSEFLKHRKVCKSAKFKCNICNKGFINQSKLEEHKSRHIDETVFKCGYENCMRGYLYKRNLIQHIKKYHKQIESSRCACPEPNCNATFTRMQNLQKHINNNHSKEKVEKEKKPRRPRKDKGIPKHSTISLLTGLRLPEKMHRDMINGIPVSIIYKNTDTVNESGVHTNITENILLNEGNSDDMNQQSGIKSQELANVNTAKA